METTGFTVLTEILYLTQIGQMLSNALTSAGKITSRKRSRFWTGSQFSTRLLNLNKLRLLRIFNVNKRGVVVNKQNHFKPNPGKALTRFHEPLQSIYILMRL